MTKSLYIDKISHRVLFIGGVVYILNYLFDGLLSNYLALNPEAILQNWEFWRLVTFPFSTFSLEGILLFGFTFLIIGPKVEQYIGRYIYPFVLSLLVLLEGILLTLAFWKENVAIGGMEGLSFFVLTLYSLLYFGKKSDFSNYRPTKARMIVSLVAFAWASVLLTRALLTANMHHLITDSVSAAIGLFSGALLYIQLRMLKRAAMQKKRDFPDIDIPKPEELSLAMIAQRERKRYQNDREDNYQNEPEFTFTEDRLNEILDKINEYGKDSLSKREIEYLKEYSRQI